MDVIFAVLADSANISQEGKLNILGTFGHINATEFPARHPEMQLVVRMEASPAEAGMAKNLEVKILDQDGKQIGSYKGDLTVPPPKTPGDRALMQLIMRLIDTVFPNAGRYVFAILIDGKTEHEVRLDVGGT
jgi:hypothetical protein